MLTKKIEIEHVRLISYYEILLNRKEYKHQTLNTLGKKNVWT